MLTVKDLCFSYRNKKVLEDINFNLEYGQLVSLLGANGAGKTTLFRCILQLLEDYEGEVKIADQNLKDMKQRERAKTIAYIPQECKGAFNYTVEEIVLMGTTYGAMFTKPKLAEISKMEEALKKIGIYNLKNRRFTELSGGERQLVLIARALAQDTRILIMDEPTSNLDFGNQIYLMQLTKDLAAEGYLVLLSTHNPDFAQQYSNRVLILHDKSIIGDGHPNKVLTGRLLSRIYNNNIIIANVENSHLRTCIPGSKAV